MKKLLIFSVSLLLANNAYSAEATHPCKGFAHDGASLSATRTVTDVLPLIAAASSPLSASFNAKFALAVFPAYDAIAQYEAKNCIGKNSLLAKIATTFSNRFVVSAVVTALYLYAVNVLKMTDNSQIFDWMMYTLYGQYSLAIIAAQLEKAESIN